MRNHNDIKLLLKWRFLTIFAHFRLFDLSPLCNRHRHSLKRGVKKGIAKLELICLDIFTENQISVLVPRNIPLPLLIGGHANPDKPKLDVPIFVVRIQVVPKGNLDKFTLIY